MTFFTNVKSHTQQYLSSTAAKHSKNAAQRHALSPITRPTRRRCALSSLAHTQTESALSPAEKCKFSQQDPGSRTAAPHPKNRATLVGLSRGGREARPRATRSKDPNKLNLRFEFEWPLRAYTRMKTHSLNLFWCVRRRWPLICR